MVGASAPTAPLDLIVFLVHNYLLSRSKDNEGHNEKAKSRTACHGWADR